MIRSFTHSPCVKAGAVAAVTIALMLSGCDSGASLTPESTQSAPAPQWSEAVDNDVPIDSAVSDAQNAWSATHAATDTPDLDIGALDERGDPERLLRFYIAAVRVGDWDSAAKAWSLDALMTPEKLRASFIDTANEAAGARLAVGRGDSEKAGGTLFYVAPVTVNSSDGRPTRRGTVVLGRDANVPNASAIQQVWRIKRTTLTP